MKGRSFLTNLISCYDKFIHLVDEGKAAVYLEFSKAFDTIFLNILERNWLFMAWMDELLLR